MIPKYCQYVTLNGPVLLGAQGLLTHSALKTATQLSWANCAIWCLGWGQPFLSSPELGFRFFLSHYWAKSPVTVLLLGFSTFKIFCLFLFGIATVAHLYAFQIMWKSKPNSPSPGWEVPLQCSDSSEKGRNAFWSGIRSWAIDLQHAPQPLYRS